MLADAGIIVILNSESTGSQSIRPDSEVSTCSKAIIVLLLPAWFLLWLSVQLSYTHLLFSTAWCHC